MVEGRARSFDVRAFLSRIFRAELTFTMPANPRAHSATTFDPIVTEFTPPRLKIQLVFFTAGRSVARISLSDMWKERARSEPLENVPARSRWFTGSAGSRWFELVRSCWISRVPGLPLPPSLSLLLARGHCRSSSASLSSRSSRRCSSSMSHEQAPHASIAKQSNAARGPRLKEPIEWR